MESPDVIDGWFKVVSGQGIGLAFLAAFLGIFLLGTAAFVRLCIKRFPELVDWLVKLAKSTLEMQESLKENNARLVDMAERDRRDLGIICKGNAHVINGFQALAEKHGERLGIGSDVLVHFKNAQKEYDRREAIERRNEHPPRTNYGTE